MEEKIYNILKNGVSLENIGVNNWALTSMQSLSAISQLMLNGIAIYGGDVLIKKDGRYHHVLDNWYSERGSGELWEAFLMRSTEESRLKIEYYSSVYEYPFFALVVQAEKI